MTSSHATPHDPENGPTALPGPGTVLAVVGAERARQVAADLAVVQAIVAWAVEHQIPAGDDPDTDASVFGPQWIQVAGEGAPLIDEFALYELAATLARSVDSARGHVGDILEVRYRLPRLWARLETGGVPPWRAFKIAARTHALCPAGATYVDTALAHVAHTTTLAQIDRTITEAITRHDPDEAARRAAADRETRHVDIDLDPQLGCYAGLTAVIRLHAVLDAEDALDLETTLRRVATQLGTLGSHDSLDIRRARALGEIARAQSTLDLTTDSTADSETSTATGSTGRGITLYAHLRTGDTAAQVDTAPLTGSVLIDQVRAWCQQAGTTVTVYPVIDLAENLRTDAYTATTRQQRQLALRDQHCIAPYCTKRPVHCDHDHTDAFADGGSTSSHNLALLCRRHHRAKTHHPGWTYQMLHPGTYHWTLPTGRRFIVDHHGTHPLTEPGDHPSPD